MKFILIFVFAFYGGEAPTSAGSVEFRTMAACQSAAAVMKKQAAASHATLPILLCAVKGES